MPKAIWNGVILAESNRWEKVEGNYYFPPDSLNRQYFKKCDLKTVCFWKGTASYYNIEVEGQVNQNAAWYYPKPSKAARNIKGYVAFQNGVKIEKSEDESSPGGGILTYLRRLISV